MGGLVTVKLPLGVLGELYNLVDTKLAELRKFDENSDAQSNYNRGAGRAYFDCARDIFEEALNDKHTGAN